VLSLDPRVRAVAVKRLAQGAAYLNALGFLPAMMLVELMAQVGGLLIDEEGAAKAQHAVLAGITRMHLHGTARAGETVQVECRLARRLGDLYRIECAGRVGSRELAHGVITLRRSRAEQSSPGGAARGAGGRA
jgi:predicted hotdog family 3-hydroxylacyl-ACP dehydratase